MFKILKYLYSIYSIYNSVMAKLETVLEKIVLVLDKLVKQRGSGGTVYKPSDSLVDRIDALYAMLQEGESPKPEPEPEPEPKPNTKWVLKDLTDEDLNKWTLDDCKTFFTDYSEELQADTPLAWKIGFGNAHVKALIMGNWGVLTQIPGAMTIAMVVQSYTPPN